jgi:hypothetical protein
VRINASFEKERKHIYFAIERSSSKTWVIKRKTILPFSTSVCLWCYTNVQCFNSSKTNTYHALHGLSVRALRVEIFRLYKP